MTKNTISHAEISERYRRAQAFIEGYRTNNLVQNDTLFPIWIEGTDCFWYERTYQTRDEALEKIGKEYRLVNAKAATNQAAFDHARLAQTLSRASGQLVTYENLPISQVAITLEPLNVRFKAFDKHWQFNDEHNTCDEMPPPDKKPINEALSPDGKQIAFTRNYNLWVRDLTSGNERALTEGGEEDYAYGAGNTAWGAPSRPEIQVLWSPDSKRLLTVKRDKRKVKTLPMVNHVPGNGNIRPQLTMTKVAYPGDQHIETYRPLAVDVNTGKICDTKYQPIAACFNDYYGFLGKLMWWAADSRYAYFIDQQRGDRVVRLVKFDTDTGATDVLFEDTSDTHVNIIPDLTTFPLHRILPETNELIWWSERKDWGHLYLYDLSTGTLKNEITAGDWRVRDVVRVDETRREVWLQTSARVPERDPYYRDICRVCIDTGEITTVLSTDEEIAVHYQESSPALEAYITERACQQTCGVSPNGEFVVATRSRADQAPVSLLIDREGNDILPLEEADISVLPTGWQWPEPLKMLAADGKTDIYGLLFRPSNFCPDEQYPVINYVVSIPSLAVVPKGSFHSSSGYVRHYFFGASLAELGFIVVFIDSRGTPLRSKAFQDESYGWMPSSANKEDHLGGLKQLAARYPFMDMNRVGVFTNNGFCSALHHFLSCQDIYKVCVALSVLDTRLISSTIEGDKWEGCDGPIKDARYPEDLVENLQGKLMLMHAITSIVSPAYPPTAAFRVVDALQKANKDFEMLMVPDGGFMCTSYMFRRGWDYLVKHLLGVEPPKEFRLENISS